MFSAHKGPGQVQRQNESLLLKLTGVREATEGQNEMEDQLTVKYRIGLRGPHDKAATSHTLQCGLENLCTCTLVVCSSLWTAPVHHGIWNESLYYQGLRTERE